MSTENTESNVRKWTKIGAGLVAALVAVLVSLGVIEEDTGEQLTADADCVQRCLSGYEEEDPEFMGPNGEAMMEAPVSDHDVQEIPVEEDTEEDTEENDSP
tara:strand:+ start:99 stop:401 length:303 start_codon:yes stop_codon:yes gene_type:complete